MLRRNLLLGAGAALTAACAGLPRVPGDETDAPLSADEEGRPVASAMINGRGPFPCVIDTAAQRTGLGQTLIEELALTPIQSGGAVLHGSGGGHSISLYQLESLAVAGVTQSNVIAVPLLHRHETRARAIVGADTFAGRRLIFDYAAGRLRVGESGEGWERTWRTVSVEFAHDTFVLAPVSVGAVTATAVIDTGAKHTAGNQALLHALGLEEAALPVGEPITGVAGTEVQTRIGRAPSLRLAGERFGPLGIAFGALSVFAALGIDDRPALILGSDFLRTLRGLSIDYGARMLAIRR